MSDTHTDVRDPDPELMAALAAEYQHNCDTVASASEDLHHRNLARMALLSDSRGIEVNPFELVNVKLEILLDELVGEDVLRRHLIGMKFQQRLSEMLTALETDPEE